MRTVLLGLGLLLALTGAAAGQVEAKTPTPEDVKTMEQPAGDRPGDLVMPNPMLLEIPVKAHDGTNGLAWMKAHSVKIWSSREQAQYVVDRARVATVTLEHGKVKGPAVEVEIGARIQSAWFRQDIDVTMSLVDAEGRVLGKEHWDDVTFGNDSTVTWGGRTKTLTLKAKVPAATFSAWLANESIPVVKILLDVQGDEEE